MFKHAWPVGHQQTPLFQAMVYKHFLRQLTAAVAFTSDVSAQSGSSKGTSTQSSSVRRESDRCRRHDCARQLIVAPVAVLAK
jgi:hypothetical protein